MHFSGQWIPIIAQSSLRRWQNMTRYPQAKFLKRFKCTDGTWCVCVPDRAGPKIPTAAEIPTAALCQEGAPGNFGRSEASSRRLVACTNDTIPGWQWMARVYTQARLPSLMDLPAFVVGRVFDPYSCWLHFFLKHMDCHDGRWKMDTRFLMFSYGMDFWKLWKDWVDKLQLKGFCCLENADELQHL